MDLAEYEPKESIKRSVISKSGKLTVLKIVEVKEMFIPLVYTKSCNL